MKKIMLSVVALILAVIPFTVKATNSKVQVYIFRGEGCPHCEDALEFFSSLGEDEKAKYDLTTYEVWYDSKNKELMQKVADKLNDTTTGVPYIVIGEKTFKGFAEDTGNEILEVIDTMYESGDTTDVVAPIADGIKNDGLVIAIFVAVLVAATGLIVVARKKM